MAANRRELLQNPRLAGGVLLFGIALFFFTVFASSTLQNVFAAEDTAEATAVIEGARVEWMLASFGLGIGALLVGLGLWVLANFYRLRTTELRDKQLAQIGGALCLIAGAGYFVSSMYNGLRSPAGAAAAPSDLDITFIVYVLSFLLGLACLAFVAVRSNNRRWIAVVLGVIVAIHLLQFVAWGDISPVTIYVMLTPIGFGFVARPVVRGGEQLAPA